MFEEIKKIMDKKGITIPKLAKKLNIPLQTVYHWFYGHSKPSLKYVIKLSKYFKKPYEFFLQQ